MQVKIKKMHPRCFLQYNICNDIDNFKTQNSNKEGPEEVTAI